MDATTGTIIIIALFAVIVVAAFLVFRQRGKVSIKGPLGTGLELDASNQPPATPPAVQVKNVKAKKGGLLAEDGTGRGVLVDGAEVQDDILAISLPDHGPDPNPEPPA